MQSAYGLELGSGSSLHDRDLPVVEAKCHDDVTSERCLCEVKFIPTSNCHPALSLWSSPIFPTNRFALVRIMFERAD
jgi:hypothetical protein